MRKTSIALIAAVALVGTLAPAAQAIGVFGSYWNGKDTDNGYGAGLIHKFKVIPLISVDVRASWVDFGDKDVSIIPLEATGRVKLAMLYGGIGVGYYFFDSDADIDNDVGGFAVLGAEFAPAGLGVFGEVKYTLLETDAGPVKVDAGGFGVNVGVVFGW